MSAQTNHSYPFVSSLIKRLAGARLLWLITSSVLGLAVAVGLLAALAPTAYAATFTVTNTNDSGPGSLRAAIQSANTTPGKDTITFNLTGCPCVIALSSPLAITDSLIINGPSASSLILDGGGAVRVLYSTNVPLSISGLTVQRGNAGAANGGGIYAGGALTLTQVSLLSNNAPSGGGAYVVGRLLADHLTASGNSATNGSGGGLYSGGNVIAIDSLIQNNRVITNGYGGGLLVLGVFTGTNVDFIGNAVYNGYDGGGLYAAGRLKLSGGQFINNRTTRHKGYGGGGGLITFGPTSISGTMFISNTSADWGGGAYIASFVNKLSDDIANAQFISNTAQSGGGGGLFMWFTSTLTTVDFKANRAGYRGGGAYAGYAGNYRTVINGGTLQGNTAAGGGGLYSDSSFSLSGTQVLSNTSLKGNGGGAWTPTSASVSNVYIAYNTVITGGNSGGLDTGGSVTITNSTFFKNRTLTGSGGGSGAGGNATLTNVQYISNTANNLGGGLIAYGTATVVGGQFISNTAAHNWGGGFYAAQSAAVTGTQFLHNVSTFAGGGLAVQFGTGKVSGGRFESNTAASGGWGGAIYAGGPSLTISGTQFLSNTAGYNGGGTTSNATTLTNTTYLGNSAQGYGGGVECFGSTHVFNSLFQNNSSQLNGGGISCGSTLSITNTQFINNLAHGDGQVGGGGVAASQMISVYKSRFERNSAPSVRGGAIYAVDGLHINESQILGNTAGEGGGVYQAGGDGRVVNSLFARNDTYNATGDALSLASSGNIQILQSTIASPTLANGSALYINAGTLTLANTIVASHTIGILQTGGAVNAEYNLFFSNTLNTQGGGISNSHPVFGDPAFFNPLQDDYHLGAGSAAVNSGTNAGVDTDFDGDARPQGSGYDIGYDEAVPPEGLSASSDSPTKLGSATTFTATITFGRSVSYQWNFGDGATGSGSPISHVYTAPGVYNASVTAANAAGTLNASIMVNVIAPTINLYLPFVQR